jgi:hypothetical protein
MSSFSFRGFGAQRFSRIERPYMASPATRHAQRVKETLFSLLEAFEMLGNA